MGIVVGVALGAVITIMTMTALRPATPTAVETVSSTEPITTPSPDGVQTPAPAPSPAPVMETDQHSDPDEPSPNSRDLGCPTLDDSDQSWPMTTPTGGTWIDVHGITIPTLQGHGPALFVDEWQTGHCYSRTPIGAVLTAMHATQLIRVGGFTFIEGQGTSPKLDEHIEQAAKEDAEYADENADGGAEFTIVGYVIRSYTRSRAEIGVVLGEATIEQRLVWDVSLQWENGDWKIVIPDKLSDVVQIDAATTDWVEWHYRSKENN